LKIVRDYRRGLSWREFGPPDALVPAARFVISLTGPSGVEPTLRQCLEATPTPVHRRAELVSLYAGDGRIVTQSGVLAGTDGVAQHAAQVHDQFIAPASTGVDSSIGSAAPVT
jgi:hypothetical protein